MVATAFQEGWGSSVTSYRPSALQVAQPPMLDSGSLSEAVAWVVVRQAAFHKTVAVTACLGKAGQLTFEEVQKRRGW